MSAWPAIPLADAPLLGAPVSRQRIVRAVLALAIAGVLLASVATARAQPVQHSSFFPAGESGVVVLDFSTSIDVAGYRRITNVLRPVVEANQPVGVVYFSDVGYVALPPASPGRELRPFLRFLRVPPPLGPFASSQAVQRAVTRRPIEDTPWSAAFRGGTRISSGLEVARSVLQRDRVKGTVLLISDLDDSLFDIPALGEVLTLYKTHGVDLRIVPLFPAPDDRAFFQRVLGSEAFVSHAELLRNAQAKEQRSLQSAFPAGLLALGGALLLLLAANELLCGRLEWRRR